MKTAQHNLQESEAAGLDRLPDMSDNQFQQWVSLLQDRTGTVVPPERRSFLVTNIGLRMREIGCRSYGEYFEHLTQGVNGLQEWHTLVDRLTVHETRFYRHPQSLQLVRDYAKEKAAGPNGEVSVQLWSAACSTGEEAYTLAMEVDQVLSGRGDKAFFGITATDISQASLHTGRQGVYNGRRLQTIPQRLRTHYFKPVDNTRFQVDETLRKRVCFMRLNILDIAKAPIGKMDIIYCQNLLIYFDRATRFQIVDHMVEHLVPGGLLILGSGEIVQWNHAEMEKISCSHTLAYRKKGAAGQEAKSYGNG